jgi:hypothetical protein
LGLSFGPKAYWREDKVATPLHRISSIKHLPTSKANSKTWLFIVRTLSPRLPGVISQEKKSYLDENPTATGTAAENAIRRGVGDAPSVYPGSLIDRFIQRQ